MLKIEVTEDDILLGDRESCDHCPIARALTRALINKGERVYTISVDTEEIVYTLHDDYLADHKWKTPQVAADFIYAFDKGMQVFPISFTLDPKDEKIDELQF